MILQAYSQIEGDFMQDSGINLVLRKSPHLASPARITFILTKWNYFNKTIPINPKYFFMFMQGKFLRIESIVWSTFNSFKDFTLLATIIKNLISSQLTFEK